jgi:glucose-6-phosphate isomerase
MTAGPLEAKVAERLALWEEERVADRLWARDGTLWGASGKDPDEVAAWLGWLDLPEGMSGRVEELEHLARDVRADGYPRAAVLGMGGSSLAPEVFSRVFGHRGRPGPDGMDLRILDSTHPDAVRGFREWAQSARTLFCVSSKSGSTTEPNAFHAAMSAFAPALDFVAITDPGSSLADLARAQEFRAIVEGRPDVGGRYSALSVFGLFPAALAGVDLSRLLANAAAMAERCRLPAMNNWGLWLGVWMGEAALAGRDKLTILAPERLQPFADWAEQLVAESTGKQGTGIIPIVREPLLEPEAYSDDRVFVAINTHDHPGGPMNEVADSLERLGHPVERLELEDIYDLGGQFFQWELATAAAGLVLGIDPFDQPNVQESKDATRSLLDTHRRQGSLPQPAPLVAETGVAAYGDPGAIGDEPVSVDGAVRALVETVQAGDYVAILVYLPQDPDVEAKLQGLRGRLARQLGVATTLGFGPRFLHSTGQLHKGGPASGVFLQITAEPRRDLPIPGWEESFGTLVAAQALGDLESLQSRGRRVLRLHFAQPDDVPRRLAELLSRAMPAGVHA